MARKKRTDGKKKPKAPRKGQLRLTDMELMAFQLIQDLAAKYRAELQRHKDLFGKDLARRHGLPERLNISVDVGNRMATWEEVVSNASTAQKEQA